MICCETNKDLVRHAPLTMMMMLFFGTLTDTAVDDTKVFLHDLDDGCQTIRRARSVGDQFGFLG